MHLSKQLVWKGLFLIKMFAMSYNSYTDNSIHPIYPVYQCYQFDFKNTNWYLWNAIKLSYFHSCRDLYCVIEKHRNDMIIRKPSITLLRTKQTSAWYWGARKQTRRMYIVPIEWWPTTFYVYFLSDIKNMYNILQG